MFDLDAYLGRIGIEGRPSLAQLHRGGAWHADVGFVALHGGDRLLPIEHD